MRGSRGGVSGRRTLQQRSRQAGTLGTLQRRELRLQCIGSGFRLLKVCHQLLHLQWRDGDQHSLQIAILTDSLLALDMS